MMQAVLWVHFKMCNFNFEGKQFLFCVTLGEQLVSVCSQIAGNQSNCKQVFCAPLF